MKEADQLKKLMEAVDTTYQPIEEIVNVGEPDPMTGEPETMPDDVISIHWKATPEEVIQAINDNLGGWGMHLETYNDGSGQVKVAITSVDR